MHPRIRGSAVVASAAAIALVVAGTVATPQAVAADTLLSPEQAGDRVLVGRLLPAGQRRRR